MKSQTITWPLCGLPGALLLRASGAARRVAALWRPNSFCFGLLLFAATSNATPVFFTNEANFQNAVSSAAVNLTIESFESLSDLTSAPFTIGNTTVSPVGSTLVTIFTPSTLATDGTAIVGWNTGSSPAEIEFSFAQPINAFGIDVIDLGDSTPPGVSGPVPASLKLTIDSGSEVLFTNFTGADGNVLFGGVIDTMNAFTTAAFEFTGFSQGEFVAFDRLQIPATPEPTTLALFSLGVAGIGVARRRKLAT